MDNSDFTQATFTSSLDYDILIYDSFNPSHPSDAESNYLGQLTSLGTLKAKSTTTILPIRVLSSFVLEKAGTTEPLKRCIVSQSDEKQADFSFSLAQSDEDTMTLTLKFIDFLLANPNDPLVIAFTSILTSGSKTVANDVNNFFTNHTGYAACTYTAYMMGLVYRAQHPALPPPAPDPSKPAPAPVRSYSLSTIVRLLGSQWPQGMEDITVNDLNIAFTDNGLDISVELDFTTLSFENDEVAGNVKKLVTDTTIRASLTVNCKVGLNVLGTRMLFKYDNFSIPVSDSDKINVTTPCTSIDINPLFKFVVFTLTGAIPATIFNTPVNVDISLAVDNDEAAIGAVVEGNDVSLPPPPGIKGLHFDSIGVGMGLFFKPPGFAFGVEGKFHIGETTGSNVITLDDDTFAVVCEYVGEVIKPKYLAFSVPKLDLNTIVELFTNANPNIDVPVEFSDLSFHWSDGLMDSVVLPDGSLSPGGYGFSAAVQIFSFGFYGEANLDINTGLTANLEVSPISWNNVFKLTGDGKGFSIKTDANDDPIPNNFVPTTQAGKDAVANAATKQIVTPGGPVLIINTLSMPILHLNAKASLFDLVDYAIQADINKDGIKFELDYGVVLTEKMVCTLTDFHNLYAEFGYHIDQSIPVPPINGQSLGSIPLKADVDAHLSLTTSTSQVIMTTGGQFDFEGYHFSFGDFSGVVNFSRISDLIGGTIYSIVSAVNTVFGQLLGSAELWAAAACKGAVIGFDDAGKVLNNAFRKSAQEMVAIFKGAGFAADDIAKGLKNGYNTASQDVAALLKQADYDATTIGNAVKNTWNCSIDDVSWALQQAGYGAEDVANAVENAFHAAAQDVAKTLKKWSFAADDVAKVIKDVFNGDFIAVAKTMMQAGYTLDDISRGIKDAWNCGETDVASALKAVGYEAEIIAGSLKNVFNAAPQEVATALKSVGYGADDVAFAIKIAWQCGINDITQAMQQAGFVANDICDALDNEMGAADQDVANAFKQFGIIAQDTANAIKTQYNRGINDVASVLKQAGYATADVAAALKNAFNTSVNAVADAMKQVGYAANDVKNAFDSLDGDFKNLADTAWNDVKNAFNPSKW